MFTIPPALSGTPLISLVGARGGLGTSTLAAAIALEAAAAHEVALIDGAPRNSLEVLMGMDEHQGPDWQSIERMQEQHSGLVLRPSQGLRPSQPCTVLAWNDITPIADSTIDIAIDALMQHHSLAVADAGTWSSSVERRIAAHSSAIFFLVPGELRALTHAVHLVRSLSNIAPVHLIVRRPSPSGISDEHLADLLNLPLAGVLEHDKRLAVRGEHAQLPTRSLRTTARQVLSALGL